MVILLSENQLLPSKLPVADNCPFHMILIILKQAIFVCKITVFSRVQCWFGMLKSQSTVTLLLRQSGLLSSKDSDQIPTMNSFIKTEKEHCPAMRFPSALYMRITWKPSAIRFFFFRWVPLIHFMNGITDAHIVWRAYKNVHVGYSIHTFIKRPKSTFYSYN